MLKSGLVTIAILVMGVFAHGQTVHKDEIYGFVGEFEEAENDDFSKLKLLDWGFFPKTTSGFRGGRDIRLEYVRQKQLNGYQRRNVYSINVRPEYDMYRTDSLLDSDLKTRFYVLQCSNIFESAISAWEIVPNDSLRYICSFKNDLRIDLVYNNRFKDGSTIVLLRLSKMSLREGAFGFYRFYSFDEENCNYELLHESRFNLEHKYRYAGPGRPGKLSNKVYFNSEFEYGDTNSYLDEITETTKYVNASRLPNSSCDTIVYDSIVTTTIPLWDLAIEKFGLDTTGLNGDTD